MGEVEVLDSDTEEVPRTQLLVPGPKGRGKLRPGLAGGVAGRILGGLRQEGRAVLRPAAHGEPKGPRSAKTGMVALKQQLAMLKQSVSRKPLQMRQPALQARTAPGQAILVEGRLRPVVDKVEKPQLVRAADVRAARSQGLRPRPSMATAKQRPICRTAQELRLLKKLQDSMAGDEPSREAPPPPRGDRSVSQQPGVRRPAAQDAQAQASASRAANPQRRRASSSASTVTALSEEKEEEAPAAKRPKRAVARTASDKTAHVAVSKVTAGVADEVSFKAAVYARLKELCGDEHDDAEVLAEYVMIMLKGNKSSVEMASELVPFFQDKAEAFVTWVEETRIRMQKSTEGLAVRSAGATITASSRHARCSQDAAAESSRSAQHPQTRMPSSAGAMQRRAIEARKRKRKVVSPPSSSSDTSSGDVSVIAEEPSGPTARQRPLTAVTTKCVLQPNPDVVGQPIRREPHLELASAVASSSRASMSPSLAGTTRGIPPTTTSQAMALRSFKGGSVKREKKELLENMTKQLQKILEKLSDKGLNDETREKYQTLAQTIQMQMFKISKPAQGRSGR